MLLKNGSAATVYNGCMARTVRGQAKTWQLMEVIGKGDAGEVLRVKPELGDLAAVMKRPVQNVSGGTIVRQALQIEIEGKVLAQLNGLQARRSGLTIHTPLLLDQSISGTSGTAGLFIVSEEIRGASISTLLKQLFQEEEKISQVLVLKVLNGLFELLRQVHQRGIIWNDVKMDHIFWERESDTLSFIDWGNSLFINASAPSGSIDPALDYAQLITEGASFLKQTAPDLLRELDWPTNGAALTSQEIEALHLRVEYFQTILSMRVVDYQIQLQKFTTHLNSADALASAFKIVDLLDRLGVRVETSNLLQAASRLAVEEVQVGNWSEAQRIAAMLPGQDRTGPNSPWKLAGELFRLAGLQSKANLSRMLTAILQQDWPLAAWQLADSDLDEGSQQQMLQALRQAGLPAAIASRQPRALLQEVLTTLDHEIEAQKQLPQGEASLAPLEDLAERLAGIHLTWGTLPAGEQLGDSLLALREALEAAAASGLEMPAELPRVITALLGSVRSVYQAWLAEDLEAARQALLYLLLADPEQSAARDIYLGLIEVQNWNTDLTAGPHEDETVNHFGMRLLSAQPKVIQHLGLTPWLEQRLQMAELISEARDLEDLRQLAQAENWPLEWLEYRSLALDLPDAQSRSQPLSPDAQAALDQFHLALRLGEDPQASLEQIHQLLPDFHSGYSHLAIAFANAFSSIATEKDLPSLASFPEADQQRIQESLLALQRVRQWIDGDPQHFSAPPKKSSGGSWAILDWTSQANQEWKATALPVLTNIRKKKWGALALEGSALGSFSFLREVARALAEFQKTWDKIAYQGVYPEAIQTLVQRITSAHEVYFSGWQALEHHPNPAMRWVIQTNQMLFSSVNQTLAQITRQLRTAVQAALVLRQPESARTRLAQNSAADLMYALVQLEEISQPIDPKRSVIRDWQKQYLHLLTLTDPDAIRKEIEALEPIHPLLPWLDELVRRDTGYFDFPDQRKW